MKFSIIIALAPYRKIKVLESLGGLNYPKKEYEVIVERGYNPSKNRNKGIKKAKGEILFFVDDDAIVDINILKNAELFFKKYDIDIVGGPQLTPKSDPFFAKVSGYVMESKFGTSNMSLRYKRGKLNLNANEAYLTSANLFIKKEVFKTAKGFDPNLFPGEDPELISRLKKSGFKIAYSSNLIIYHKRRLTFSEFFKQFFNYGKTHVNYKKRILKERISLLHLIPTFFTLYLLLLPLLIAIHFLLVVPFMVYTILILLFSISISISKKHISAFPYLPFLFFSIHISYGLGLLKGLTKK